MCREALGLTWTGVGGGSGQVQLAKAIAWPANGTGYRCCQMIIVFRSLRAIATRRWD